MKSVFFFMLVALTLSVSCSSRSKSSSLSKADKLAKTKYYYNVFGVDKPNNAIPSKSTQWFESKSSCKKARLVLLKSRLKQNLEMEVVSKSGWFGSDEKLSDVVMDPDYFADYESTTFIFPDEDLISKISPCKQWQLAIKK